jgi:hypothetical protein
LPFTPAPTSDKLVNCPAGSVTVAFDTTSGALAGPSVNDTPPAVTVDPNRLDEYAYPPRSNPPVELNVVPSVTIPLTLYADARFTATLEGEEPPLATVRVTCADCCKLPEAPVMVTGYEPAAVEEEVETVMVEVPAPLTAVGLNVAVAPVGNPLALKVTVPLNPPVDPIVAV